MERSPSHPRVSRRAGALIAGPGLSAVRAACQPYGEQLADLAPVFERVGQALDSIVCQPDLDSFFAGETRQIVVAISDASWGDETVLTAYGEPDVRPICVAADKALKATIHDCKIAGADVRPETIISVLWANWTVPTRASIRDSDTCTSPELPVGALFTCSAVLRGQLDAIATANGIPVLAVALNSIGSTRRHPKCSLRAIVFPLPSWARASGAVAGHA